MKKLLLGSAALLGVMVTGNARALDLAPPAGAIIDVASLVTTTTAAYVPFTATFSAGQANTVVSFLFRRDPSYFAFDDASVALTGGGPNLLANPGFESGPVGSITPVGWGNFQQTTGIAAIGVVQSGSGRGGEGPRTGLNFWDDGAVGAYDGIYQTVATTVGQNYTVTFYLANPGSGATYSRTGTGIDVLAYAGAALPDGTVVTVPAPPPVGIPEPTSMLLLAGSLASLGLLRRR